MSIPADVPDELVEAYQAVTGRLGTEPVDTAVVFGSGLGDVAHSLLQDVAGISYDAIPGMPQAGHAVGGHLGELHIGRIGTHRVALFLGRYHLYQGLAARDVVFPIRLAAALGAQDMILTNAAGSLDEDLSPGALMLIADHLNLTNESPLDGRRPIHTGSPFVSMANAYSMRLRTEAHWIARHVGIELAEGVYVGVRGPHYETAAEVHYFHAVGGNAIGMSTVIETIAARALGLKVMGISCITNRAGVAGNHDDVLRAAAAAHKNMGAFLSGFLHREEFHRTETV